MTNSSTYISVLLLFLFFLTNDLSAQSRSNNSKLFIGGHAGMVSFFGDLGVNDNNPVRKLTHESNIGYGIMAGRKAGRIFTIKAEFLNGSMKGENPELGYNFSNDFWHITGGLQLSIRELVNPHSQSRFDYFANLSGGYMEAKANRNQLPGFTDNVGTTVESSSPIIMAGLGISYNLTNYWQVSARMHGHYTFTDLLDAHDGTATNINDYYTYLSLGIAYVLGGNNNQVFGALPCSDW